jgi:hypothetical protein
MMSFFASFEMLIQDLASAVFFIAVAVVVVEGCLIRIFTTAVTALILSNVLDIPNMVYVLGLYSEMEFVFAAKTVTGCYLVTLERFGLSNCENSGRHGEACRLNAS